MRRLGILAASLTFVATPAWAATINVGPGDDYSKIEAAGPGDEVVIAPGTYKFRVYLSGQGTEAAPIVIRAADPANRPVFDLGPGLVEDAPGSYTGGDNGRGCWQIAGSYYAISGLEFQNCRTSGKNAAGIRSIAADHLSIKDVVLHDNDAGFTGDGESVSLEFCELYQNGQGDNPPQHNIYVYGGSFALRYSYVHDSVGGQNLHIRAREATIEANWIARAANYEADIMTGNDPSHTMTLIGNVFVGSPTPENHGHVMALYNDSGTSGISMALKAYWNTFVVQAPEKPVLVNVLNETLASATVELSNNIIVGTDKAYGIANSGNANTTVSGTNNWLVTGSDAGALAGTLFGADPGFGTDYRLASGSTAIGAASASVAVAADREYFENETNAKKFRWRTSRNDLGAFETTTTGAGFGPYDDPGTPGGAGGAGGGGGATSSGGSSAGGTSAGGSGAKASGGSAGNQAGGSSNDDGGCGCRAAPREGFEWSLLIALAVLARKIRPARPRSVGSGPCGVPQSD